MKRQFFITSLITLSLLLLTDSLVYAAGCQIENGPIPEIATYMRSVTTELGQISKMSRSSNGCGIVRGGASQNIERTTHALDSLFLGFSLETNMFLDFRYNIGIAISGESRGPVVRDGRIWTTTNQQITTTATSLAAQCALEGEVRSRIATLLEQNQILENIYKQAALGIPASPTGLSSQNLLVANAINLAYIPNATESCQPNNNGSLADGVSGIAATFLKKIETMGAKNESAWTSWKESLALLQGNDGINGQKYSDTQRKLLQTELARQGFSSRTAQTMLGNFDCFKGKTQGDDSAEAAIKARMDCRANPFLGIENLILPWKQLVQYAPTTDARSYAVTRLSRQDTLKRAIVDTVSKLETFKTPSIDIKSSLMTNLIDIHLSLLSTTEDINKRLPRVYTDCMKAQPDIKCPKQ